MTPQTLAEINTLCGFLVGLAGRIREETDAQINVKDHVAMIKHYDHLRKACAQIKESREALAEIENNLSRKTVPEFMKAAGVKTITVEGVGRVTVSHRFSCTMLDKPMGFDWLRTNGYGDLITETVNASTLGAFAKDLIQNQGQDLPGNVFKTSIDAYTSITKA